MLPGVWTSPFSAISAQKPTPQAIGIEGMRARAFVRACRGGGTSSGCARLVGVVLVEAGRLRRSLLAGSSAATVGLAASVAGAALRRWRRPPRLPRRRFDLASEPAAFAGLVSCSTSSVREDDCCCLRERPLRLGASALASENPLAGANEEVSGGSIGP